MIKISKKIKSKNIVDSWRHATWSKESSESIGKGWTLVFGVGHEIENIIDYDSKQMTLTQLFKEVVMDLTNNKIGRSLAGTNSDLEELASDGTLETIDPKNDAEYKSVTKDEKDK